MEIREEAYNKYWEFASKRQDIFFKRFTGEARPWTDDPILNEYKFCNVYRASDRVSQFLINDVIYTGIQKEDEVIFRILLFKIFNKIETWSYLLECFDEISLKNFDMDKYNQVLEQRIQNGIPIYSNAYISCATKAYGFDRKHTNHLALIQDMIFNGHIVSKIIKAKHFRDVFELLRCYPLIGDFMAYQLMTDINYSDVINFDENSFTVVGPGSMRGIDKCFKNRKGKSYEYIIEWMVTHQEEEFGKFGLQFKSLWGRSLHNIDCQGLFCETDKYCRVALPELTSNRVRIKAHFKPISNKISYFYPPKWGINELITQHTLCNT
jgi:hypothetical protein